MSNRIKIALKYVLVVSWIVLMYLFIFNKPTEVSTTPEYGPAHNYIIPTDNVDDTEHIWIGGNGDTIIE